MKKILLATAIIASITACSKPEMPSPEPEDTTSKSYAGCMRSDYPDITISGISVNDKIIYDIKTAMSSSFAESVNDATTLLYSGKFTMLDIMNYDIFPIADIYISPDESIIDISIPAQICSHDEIKYQIFNGEILDKTDNIKSVNIKEAEVILDNVNFKTDFCKYDIEIVQRHGMVIRIVYSGESIHRPIY